MLKTIKRDNQMLNDYIATAFSERLTSAVRALSGIKNKILQDPKHIEQMKLKIEKLRKEIDNLRELSPRSVPPESELIRETKKNTFRTSSSECGRLMALSSMYR